MMFKGETTQNLDVNEADGQTTSMAFRHSDFQAEKLWAVSYIQWKDE